MTGRAALARLLAGSGLAFQFSGDRTVIITAAITAAAAAKDGIRSIGVVNVEGVSGYMPYGSIRELDEVREKQGATYSASAQSTTSRYFPGFGFIISRATVRPEIDANYFQTVSAIVADLKRHPITPDELTRARLPLIDRLHNDPNANGYWLTLLSGTVRDPRQVTASLVRERDLLSVTPSEPKLMAKTYFDMAEALRVQIKPKDGTATSLE